MVLFQEGICHFLEMLPCIIERIRSAPCCLKYARLFLRVKLLLKSIENVQLFGTLTTYIDFFQVISLRKLLVRAAFFFSNGGSFVFESSEVVE